jgi:hypothetical protein
MYFTPTIVPNATLAARLVKRNLPPKIRNLGPKIADHAAIRVTGRALSARLESTSAIIAVRSTPLLP